MNSGHGFSDLVRLRGHGLTILAGTGVATSVLAVIWVSSVWIPWMANASVGNAVGEALELALLVVIALGVLLVGVMSAAVLWSSLPGQCGLLFVLAAASVSVAYVLTSLTLVGFFTGPLFDAPRPGAVEWLVTLNSVSVAAGLWSMSFGLTTFAIAVWRLQRHRPDGAPEGVRPGEQRYRADGQKVD